MAPIEDLAGPAPVRGLGSVALAAHGGIAGRANIGRVILAYRVVDGPEHAV